MDPVMITIGSLEVKWYSITMLMGIILGIGLFLREGKRFNFNKDFLFNLAFWSIIFGLIGARLYYVIFKFSLYQDDLLSIFKIWEGGLAIHGGIIFAIITIIIYSKKYKVNYVKIFDMAIVPLLLGQAIGRWGNFFNNEAYGSIISYARLQELHVPEFIINGMMINGNYYHPTFFYESLWCFLGFVIVLVLRRIKYVKYGQLTAFYLIWYGIGRFFIESLRTDSLMIGGFKTAQIISIIMVIIGVVATMIISRKGKYEDLYNAEADVVRF